ncbi:hypothetical protein ACWCOP_11795 [Maricaulaceae bacterium MS644]
MTFNGKLERLQALHEALREGRPRPDSTAGWFSASALLPADGTPETLAADTRAHHDALKDRLGRSAAPTGSLRWAYAAIQIRNGVAADRFAALRDGLRDVRKSSRTGALHAGGSRAALVLTAGDLDPAEAVRRFFALKQALNPPWWRRDASVTDTFCAAHAVRGDDPRSVFQVRNRAEAVFKEDRNARGHKRTGARACALHEAEPRTVLKRFLALDAMRRHERTLRHRVSRGMLMDWAAEGLEESDLGVISQILDTLPRRCAATGEGRARLAYLVHTSDRQNLTAGAVTALAAIIAAQTAAIVAATTAATVATTSATS